MSERYTRHRHTDDREHWECQICGAVQYTWAGAKKHMMNKHPLAKVCWPLPDLMKTKMEDHIK